MADIKIIGQESYRSSNQSKTKDRIEVTLDMSMDDYSAFRLSVEAPHLTPPVVEGGTTAAA